MLVVHLHRKPDPEPDHSGRVWTETFFDETQKLANFRKFIRECDKFFATLLHVAMKDTHCFVFLCDTGRCVGEVP